MLCRALVVLAIFSTSLVAGTATAQSAASPQDLARSIGEEGLALFGKEKWQEAHDRFQSAEEMFHAPTLVLYMARCKVKLGQWIGARELYRSIENEKLPTNASTAFLSAKKEAAAELASLLPEIPTLFLVFDNVSDDRLRISLDGRPVTADKLRGGIDVNPGQHLVQVTAEGMDPGSYTFDALPGKPTRAVIPLVDHETVVQPRDGGRGDPTASEGPFERVDPLWVGIGAGATLLAASAGVVGVVVSNGAVSDMDSITNDPGCATRRKACLDDWDAANDQRVDYGNLAVWSFVTSGVAALATGAYLGFVVMEGDNGAPEAALIPSGPGLGGFSVAGKW